jgi:hypothetical protein
MNSINIKDIDVAIRDLIVEINNCPYFETTLSCAGHFRVCNAWKHSFQHNLPLCGQGNAWKHSFQHNLPLCGQGNAWKHSFQHNLPLCGQGNAWKQKYVHFDDNNLDLYEDFQDRVPKYCSPTSQPFISFKILNKNDSTILFLEKLKNSKTSFPFIVQSHNDIITYGYGDGDEGYCETTDKYSILPQFYEFWQNFIVLWKTYINPKSLLQPIKLFLLNHYLECFYCDKKKINTKCSHDGISKYTYMDIELFEDDWIDMAIRNSSFEDDQKN